MTTFGPGYTNLLQEELRRRAPATLSEEGAQRAAVAVVVAADQPAVLLVIRRERSGDPWSGHAALPGGFASPADPSLVATAVRETLEETGLHLVRDATHLGQLDDVYPRTIHLPRVIVTPVVFATPIAYPVAPTMEVERALWVGLAGLLDPANRASVRVDRPDGPHVFPSIEVDGLTIWGLTERILRQLFTIGSALT